jgi:hypothetical protein
VLPHLLYSRDLAPSVFHLFGALKDAVHGMECDIGGDVICTVHKQNKARYQQGICTLVPSWCKGIEVDRLCGKIGYGVKPSLFIMCNFHDLGLGIY